MRLHILCSFTHGLLAHLQAQIRRRIIHYSPKVETGRELASSVAGLGLLLAWVRRGGMITALRLRRGRRAHHGDGGDMLWYGMV